jgi:hypothetical protein
VTLTKGGSATLAFVFNEASGIVAQRLRALPLKTGSGQNFSCPEEHSGVSAQWVFLSRSGAKFEFR